MQSFFEKFVCKVWFDFLTYLELDNLHLPPMETRNLKLLTTKMWPNFLRKIPNREAKVALDVEIKPMAVPYAAT